MIIPHQEVIDESGIMPWTRTVLDRIALYSLTVGTVLLVLLDWLGNLQYISMDVFKYFRAFLLAVFTVYIIRTGINLRAHSFHFGRVLVFFMASCLLYSIVSENVVESLYYSVRIFFWTLGAVAAYRLFISGLLTEKIFRRMIVATVILGATCTVIFMALPDTVPGQNANAYLLLWCLPLMLMTKKSWVVNGSIAVAIYAIIITIKRGAMTALALSCLTYGLLYLKSHMNMRAFARLMCLFLILGSIGAYALSLNWDAIRTRFEDKSGSGRDVLYSIVADHYVHGDIGNKLFGFGINSVERYTGLIFHGSGTGAYAHSDWLQFTHDFGFIGITSLVWLHIQFLCLIRESFKKRYPHTPSLAMGYVIFFCVNIYSGCLMVPNTIYLGLLWAYGAAFPITIAKQQTKI